MIHPLRAALLLASLGAVAPALSGQAVPPLAPGGRVRVRTLGETGLLDRGMEGTVERLSGDTLILRPKAGGSVQVFVAGEETQLFVFAGHRSRVARGAIIGGVAGLVAGGLVGAASGEVCEGPSSLCFDRQVVAWRAGLILGACGAVSGIIIGAFASHEAWARSARLPSVRPAVSVGARGMALGFSATF